MNQKDQLDTNNTNNGSNFVHAFHVKQKEEKPNPKIYFSDDNLLALARDLFAAGKDTTAATLRWGLLLMAKYPEIQKNVRDEIERVVGSEEPRSTLRRLMPYTNAVIHEIQRFANVLPMGPRATTQDVYLKGFFIPKWTTITVVLYSVLRDKEHFEKPEEFYPQHFLDSDGNFVNNGALMPFATGKRICVGENLAKLELFLIFTTLLQNFTFHAPPGATLELTSDVGYVIAPLTHEICAAPRTGREADI